MGTKRSGKGKVGINWGKVSKSRWGKNQGQCRAGVGVNCKGAGEHLGVRAMVKLGKSGVQPTWGWELGRRQLAGTSNCIAIAWQAREEPNLKCSVGSVADRKVGNWAWALGN